MQSFVTGSMVCISERIMIVSSCATLCTIGVQLDVLLELVDVLGGRFESTQWPSIFLV